MKSLTINLNKKINVNVARSECAVFTKTTPQIVAHGLKLLAKVTNVQIIYLVSKLFTRNERT